MIMEGLNMTNEEIISDFMREEYSDERLAMLLAHAEDGRLVFQSCCCFIGVATADHALKQSLPSGEPGNVQHYRTARALTNAPYAEMAFMNLCHGTTSKGDRFDDEIGRARLIPLIRAEMERRANETRSAITDETVERSGVLA